MLKLLWIPKIIYIYVYINGCVSAVLIDCACAPLPHLHVQDSLNHMDTSLCTEISPRGVSQQVFPIRIQQVQEITLIYYYFLFLAVEDAAAVPCEKARV